MADEKPVEEKRIRVRVNAHEETIYTPEGWGNTDTVVRVIFSNATFAEKRHLVDELMSVIWDFSSKNNLSPIIEVPSYPDLPPGDGCCECCGRHADTLNRFGKSGDPIKGECEGAVFVKTYRSSVEHIDEYDKKMAKLWKEWKLRYPERKDNDGKSYNELFIELYGEEEGSKLLKYDDKVSGVSASWECRNCIVLTNNEYLQVRRRKEDSKIGPFW